MFELDPRGNPLRVTDPDGYSLAFEYDPAHRPLRNTDTRPGMPVPHSRTYDWSPGGMLNLTQDESGHRTDYLYDATGQLIGIWAPNYEFLAFSHDAGGRLTEKWFPNGTTARYVYSTRVHNRNERKPKVQRRVMGNFAVNHIKRRQ